MCLGLYSQSKWQNSETYQQCICCNHRKPSQWVLQKISAGSGNRTYIRVCILSISVNVLKKIQAGSLRQWWLEFSQMSQIHRMSFTFCIRSCMCQKKLVKGKPAGQLACHGGRASNGLSRHHPCYKRSWSKDFNDNCESVLLLRMEGMGSKLEMVKNEQFIKSSSKECV